MGAGQVRGQARPVAHPPEEIVLEGAVQLALVALRDGNVVLGPGWSGVEEGRGQEGSGLMIRRFFQALLGWLAERV